MVSNGKFIVLEGTDGSGKTEQFRILVAYLIKQKKKVFTVDFPQYGKPSAYYVEQYLKGKYGGWKEVGAKLASVFYALDRIDVAREIRSHLKKGYWVVANRYTASNMGHHGAKIKEHKKRTELIKWIYDFEYSICALPKPDLNIFLHVPAEISLKLINKRGRKKDIHDNLTHLKLAEDSYKDAVALYLQEFKVIECAPKGELLSIEKIHTLLTSIVEKLSK